MPGGGTLPAYIKADATVSNYARSGRSSKSFITEGLLEQIREKMKPHDYMLIQFGHNDQKRDEERHTEPFRHTRNFKEIRGCLPGNRRRRSW